MRIDRRQIRVREPLHNLISEISTMTGLSPAIVANRMIRFALRHSNYKDLLKSNQPAPQPTTPAVADSNTNVQYVININGQRVL
jgi:hypothetical protein